MFQNDNLFLVIYFSELLFEIPSDLIHLHSLSQMISTVALILFHCNNAIFFFLDDVFFNGLNVFFKNAQTLCRTNNQYEKFDR